MALPIPVLDDRTFADLADEARALIPILDPSWTNHNPSDPGITLLELFAWLTEMLIFSLDQITDDHRITFLRLLNGPEWQPTAALDEEISRSLALLRGRFRAVTVEDYEVLTCQASPRVKRARCVPRRNLEAATETLRRTDAPGHVSVVILPLAGDADPEGLCKDVRNTLEPARILTTRLHVVTPTFVPITTRMAVVRRSDVPADSLQADIRNRLSAWLDPFVGGDGKGWPFGGAIYVSELYRIVEGVAGVDYLGEVSMASTVVDADAGDPAAAPLWHDDGDLVGLALAPHELPRDSPTAHDVVVVGRLEPVRIAVTATPRSPGSSPLARRAVKEALDADLWSRQKQAAAQQRGFTLSVDDIRTALLAAPAVTAVVSALGPVTLQVDPARLSHIASDGSGTPAAPVATFDSGEFLETTFRVDIAGPVAP